MMQEWLGLNHLGAKAVRLAYETNPELYDKYVSNMTIGAVSTSVICVVSAILFSACLPSGTQQSRDWAGVQSWQVPSVSLMNFGIVAFMIIWSLEMVTLDLSGLEITWAKTLNEVLAAALVTYALGGVGPRLMTITKGSSVIPS